MASASPMASAAVVLAVGVSPMGQASSPTETSRTISLFLAKVDSTFPVMAITGIFSRFMNGRSFRISSVSPLFEITISVSWRDSIPRSP